MANLQQLPDLSNAGDLPTYLNQAVMGQIGQANQFNQLGLQQNQADLEAKGLANMFSRQNNPQLIEKQGLENQIRGVEARTASALEPEAREAKRAELLQKASKADLDKLLSDAQIEMQSPDPQVSARGQRKMNASWEEITRRNKFSDEMTKTREEIQGRKDVANIGASASRYGSDKGLEAAKLRGVAGGEIPLKGNIDAITANLATGIAKARAEGNQARAQELQDIMDVVQQNAYNRGAVSVGARQEGGIDLSKIGQPGQTGIPVRTGTIPTPAQFRGGQSQPQAPKSLNALPAGAEQIGTSGGKPVYQTPDGKQYIGE